MSAKLDAVIDRVGLRELGFSRRTIDHLFATLPVVAFPGQRKVYLRRADVCAHIAQHTYDGHSKVRAA